MAVQAKDKSTTLRSILEDAYQVDGKPVMNAVYAGEYFVGLYQKWQDVSDAIPSKKNKAWLDLIVTGILAGDAMNNAAFTNGVADLIGQVSRTLYSNEKRALFYQFIVSLLSGEILSNPFVLEHKERIGAAVLMDCLNESSKRALDGAARDASEINKWQVLSIIGFIVSGTTAGMRIHTNLKASFSHGH